MNRASGKRKRIARWATGLVAIAGGFAAWHLVGLHVQALDGAALDGALCGAQGAMDCESAVHSEYSELFGIPIAVLGLSFYTAILMLAFFDRPAPRTSSRPFRPAAIATTTFGIGVGYSVFLAVVSIFDLGTICPFCAMLYGVNLVGLVTSTLWAGQGPHRVIVAQLKQPREFFNGWTGVFAFAFGAVLIISTVVLGGPADEPGPPETQGAYAPSDQAEMRIDQADYRVSDAPAKGPEDAPVHIVEFSNFPCPFCGELAATLEQVAEEYGDDVRIEYRHFPIGNQPQGHRAARAAYCAGEQGEFWAMHDELFKHAPAHGPQQLERYAAKIGLDQEAFGECLESDRAEGRVDQDVAAARRLGIEGTPTFFINGQRFQGALPYDVLSEIIGEKLQTTH